VQKSPFELLKNYIALFKYSRGCDDWAALKNKKADVAEHPKAFDHVGLLSNEPPGKAGLLLI
jgi:hypothetical protein